MLGSEIDPGENIYHKAWLQQLNTQPTGGIPVPKIILIAIFTVVFFGIAVWMITPAPLTGFYWDDTWYLLMAEWFTPDSSYRELSWAMMRVTSYPPLFPLFIAWSGANLLDQQNAFIMNALFLALATGVAMLWFAREGFNTVTMVFAALLLAFNPVSLAYLSILYSEFLFTFLSTSALALTFLLNEWKWNSRWLVIGLIVGLSVATRTAGWALVAGFLVHLVLNRSLLPAVTFTIGLGAGILIIPFLMVGLPPSESYVDQLIENMGSLGWGFVVQQVQGLVAGWAMLWGWGAGAWLAAAMVLPGLLIRLKANRVDAWYVMLYFGMLLVWPWPGHMGRFLWPLLPCLLVSAHSSFVFIKNSKHRSVIPGVLIGLILVSSTPDGIARSLERLLDPPKGELFQLSRMHEWSRSTTREEGMMKLKLHQQFLKDLQQISNIVDPKACIYSEFSSLVTIQTRHVSFEPPWSSLSEVGLKAVQCEYYYMLPQSLPGTTADEVNRFSAMHQELFRSVTPDDPGGNLPLGVFLRFRPAEVK